MQIWGPECCYSLWQWHYEHPAILATGAMKAPRRWQLRDDACSDVETFANMPRFSYPIGIVVDTGGKWKKSSIRKILIILFGYLWVEEFFCILFWRARVRRPLLCLCRPFMIFEGCLDSNLECCVASWRATDLAIRKVNIYINFCLQVHFNKASAAWYCSQYLPLVSTTPVVHLGFEISPQIFKNIRNYPNVIFRGLAEGDSWKKKPEAKNLVTLSL